MEVRAITRYVGISPRKLRLVADRVRGLKVEESIALLGLLPSPSARVVSKVIKSAAANAESNFQLIPDELRIRNILVDAAPTLKRFRAQSRGRVSPILKRASHITVIVSEEE